MGRAPLSVGDDVWLKLDGKTYEGIIKHVSRVRGMVGPYVVEFKVDGKTFTHNATKREIEPR